MAGDEDQLLGGIEKPERGGERAAQSGVVLHRVGEMQQRIDHRVAGDEDAARVLALGDQVVAGFGRRGKVPARNVADDEPVELLGEGTVDIVAAQPGFDVGHGDLLVEGGQRRGHRGRGVALHHDDVGPRSLEHLLHPREHSRGDVEQRLAGGHHIEVVVDAHPGQRDDLVDHFAMLRSDANLGDKARMPHGRAGHRKAFEGFRPRAEHDQETLRTGPRRWGDEVHRDNPSRRNSCFRVSSERASTNAADRLHVEQA